MQEILLPVYTDAQICPSGQEHYTQYAVTYYRIFLMSTLCAEYIGTEQLTDPFNSLATPPLELLLNQLLPQ